MKSLACAMAMGVVLLAGAAYGSEFFVAPDGKAEAAGTMQAPWDILSTLAGQQKAVQSGDTIWVRGGTYMCEAAYKTKSMGYEVKLVGTEPNPIQVRAYQRERVIIDGGLFIAPESCYTYIYDLELAPPADKILPHISHETGSWPTDLPGPNGGLNIYGGKGSKFINLYIHDNLGGGVGFWVGSVGAEMYGCVIFGNGWKASDRNHGHCIYTQNNQGTKTISNCILSTPFGGGQFTMHAYGSAKAYVNNFLIEENIAYAPGSFLIGGGRPSENIVMKDNLISGTPVQIGYGAANINCAVTGNTIANTSVTIDNYQKADVENNLVVQGGLVLRKCADATNKDNTIAATDLPKEPKVVLLPNKYDTQRANLAIFNWQKADKVDVKVAPFLVAGDAYRVMKPEDLCGKPVVEGKCEGDTISVPVAGDFGAYVVFKNVPQTTVAVIYTCPMHPEVQQATPGKCPKCGMDLVLKK